MQNRTHQELADNIQQHRWLVFNILGDDEALPPFSYTVGLFATFGHPEVVLSGLDHDLAHAILNDIGEDAAQGIRRQDGVIYDDVLGGSPCLFKPVLPEHYEGYFGRALVFYQGADFPVLQCIWPDAQLRFPGQEDYAYTAANQELLYQPKAAHHPSAAKPVHTIALVYLEETEHTYLTEMVEAVPEGEGYRLTTIPFFAKHLALHDLIAVEEEEGVHYFEELLVKSGHSVIRVLFADEATRLASTPLMEQFGVQAYQYADSVLVAFDVPAQVAYEPFEGFLQQGEAQQLWEYEEACLGWK